MKHFLIKLILFERKHIRFLFCMFMLCLISAAAACIRAKYSTNLISLFPENSTSCKTLSKSLNSGLLNRITVYFSKKDGSLFSSVTDLSFVDTAANCLKISCPEISDIIWRTDGISAAEGIRGLTNQVTRFHSPDELPADPDAALKRCRMQLSLNPFAGAAQYRFDPFGWNGKIFMNLEKFLHISGVETEPSFPFLVSRDRKFCMMILLTDVSGTDLNGCKTLLDKINHVLVQCPDRLRCEVYSVHTHTIENQKGMTKDLFLFSILSVVLFTMLFFAVYRHDMKGLLIPFLTFSAGLFSLALVSLSGKFLIFIAGIGGVLTGLGVDYGIHLYAASCSKRKIQSMISVIPPLFFACATSVLAFAGFLFTGVPAFVQFGSFAILMLSLTFLILVLLIPAVMLKGQRIQLPEFRFLKNLPDRYGVLIFIVSVVVTGFLIFGCLRTRYNADIRNFDLSHSLHGQRETECRESFMKQPPPGILLYRDRSMDRIFEMMRSDADILKKADRGSVSIGPADFVPCKAEQQHNVKSWKKYIESGKWSDYCRKIRSRAESLDLEPDFFDPFISSVENSLRNPAIAIPELLHYPMSAMTACGKDGLYSCMMFFRSEKSLPSGLHGTGIVGDDLVRSMHDDLCGNLSATAKCVVILVLLCILAYLKSFRKMLLAIIPLCGSLLAVFGGYGLFWHEITLPVIVACIITVGISVDYGIIYAAYPPEKRNSLLPAVTLSAITTAAGGATVVFTAHPMLYSAGITVMIGITAAWFMTVILLPVLERFRHGKNLLVCIAMTFLMTGCAYEPFGPFKLTPVPAQAVCRVPVEIPCEFEGSCVLDYPSGRTSFLLAGKADKCGCTVYGFSPAGLRVFILTGDWNGMIKYDWSVKVLNSKLEGRTSRSIYNAIAARFADMGTLPEQHTGSNGERIQSGLKGEVRFSGNPPVMVSKKLKLSGKSCGIMIFPVDSASRMQYIYEDDSLLRVAVKMKIETSGGAENEYRK